MKISFLCGSHAGILGFLTLRALSHEIDVAVCYDTQCKDLLEKFGVKCFATVKDVGFIEGVKNTDLLVSVHARQMISQELIKSTSKKIGINVHPYLYAYKDADPIGRAIKDGNWKASVAVQHLTDELDSGEVICEIFKNIEPSKTHIEVYNQIYTLYIESIKKALGVL